MICTYSATAVNTPKASLFITLRESELGVLEALLFDEQTGGA